MGEATRQNCCTMQWATFYLLTHRDDFSVRYTGQATHPSNAGLHLISQIREKGGNANIPNHSLPYLA